MSHTWVGGDGSEFPLVDEYGVRELVGGTGLEGAPVAASLSARLDGGGEMLDRSWSPAAAIVLPLMFFDDDVLDDLSASMRATALLGGIRDDESGRTLTRILYVGGFEGDSGRSATGATWKRRVVELRALDPFWYGSERTVSLPTVMRTVSSAHVESSGRIPSDGGGAVSLPIVGEAPVDGFVTLTGPVTRYTFGDATHGWTMNRGVQLAAGQTLIVDSRLETLGPRRAVGGLVDWDGLLTRESTLFSVPADGRVVVGANSSAGASATFTYRSRHLRP